MFGRFIYGRAVAPIVSSITPNTGTDAGGTSITDLHGSGFQNGATVKIGGTLATSVSFVSSTQLTCTTPSSGVDAAVDVLVTNPDGQTSGTSGNGLFTYTASFTLAGLNWSIYVDGQDYDPIGIIWPGRASAGVSGNSTQRLLQDGSRNAPSSGSNLNGIQTVAFDRTQNQSLLNNRSDQFPAVTTTWTMFAVVNYNPGSHNSTAPNASNNDAIMCDDNVRWELALKASGECQIGTYTGSALVGVGSPFTNSIWQIVMSRSDGSTIEVRQGHDTWQTLGSAPVGSGRGVMLVGANWSHGSYFDGKMASLGISPVRYDDTTCNQIIGALNSRWGLSL